MEMIYFLGIDMAKKSFQAALPVDGYEMVESSVENTPEGIQSYFKDLKDKFSMSQLIVCVEHTGVYTYPLLDYLVKHKIKVCVESAVQIKRSQGIKRGKSDRIDARATSVPGVGPIIALNMIICTGEFGRITESKQFACYAGVAPFEHRSGSSVRGKTRVSKMANMNMKWLLHMGALSSINCSEELRAFYDRKVAEGENKMSVLNAVRNKLISRVFACVKNRRLYQKSYKNALA